MNSELPSPWQLCTRTPWITRSKTRCRFSWPCGCNRRISSLSFCSRQWPWSMLQFLIVGIACGGFQAWRTTIFTMKRAMLTLGLLAWWTGCMARMRNSWRRNRHEAQCCFGNAHRGQDDSSPWRDDTITNEWRDLKKRMNKRGVTGNHLLCFILTLAYCYYCYVT